MIAETIEYTASHPLVGIDEGKKLRMNSASANVVTVPVNSSTPLPIGFRCSLVQMGAGATTVAAASGVTIKSQSSSLALNGRYAEAYLEKIGADEWLLTGELASEKVFAAQIEFADNVAPTITTTIKNTLAVTPVLTRTGEGVYRFTSSDFDPATTVPPPNGLLFNITTGFTIYAVWKVFAGYVQLATASNASGSTAADLITNAGVAPLVIEIKVY
jgi:hypothetical protein